MAIIGGINPIFRHTQVILAKLSYFPRKKVALSFHKHWHVSGMHFWSAPIWGAETQALSRLWSTMAVRRDEWQRSSRSVAWTAAIHWFQMVSAGESRTFAPQCPDLCSMWATLAAINIHKPSIFGDGSYHPLLNGDDLVKKSGALEVTWWSQRTKPWSRLATMCHDGVSHGMARWDGMSCGNIPMIRTE